MTRTYLTEEKDGIHKVVASAKDDADGVFVRACVAGARHCDEQALKARREERRLRAEAGARLIEIRERLLRCSPGFMEWLAENRIPKVTAYRLMRVAGCEGTAMRPKPHMQRQDLLQ